MYVCMYVYICPSLFCMLWICFQLEKAIKHDVVPITVPNMPQLHAKATPTFSVNTDIYREEGLQNATQDKPQLTQSVANSSEKEHLSVSK